MSDEVDDGERGILALECVLNHDATKLTLGREVLHFPVAQLPHQGRLAGSVRAEDSITVTTVKLERRV